MVPMHRPEDNLENIISSFHHLGSEDWTQRLVSAASMFTHWAFLPAFQLFNAKASGSKTISWEKAGRKYKFVAYFPDAWN